MFCCFSIGFTIVFPKRKHFFRFFLSQLVFFFLNDLLLFLKKNLQNETRKKGFCFWKTTANPWKKKEAWFKKCHKYPSVDTSIHNVFTYPWKNILVSKPVSISIKKRFFCIQTSIGVDTDFGIRKYPRILVSGHPWKKLEN